MGRSNGMSPSVTFLVVVVGALAILKGCQASAAKSTATPIVETQQVKQEVTPLTIKQREPSSNYRYGWIVYTIGVGASAYFILRRRYDLRTSS